jgi:hypothetical protein
MALGHFYNVLLLVGIAHTIAALWAIAIAPPDARPWTAPVQGVAWICCALLLKDYFDPEFRTSIGGWAWLLFLYALVWSVTVWFRRLWALESDDEVPSPSVLDTFGLAVGDGVLQMAQIAWHVGFVVPALVCGAFVLFGLAPELPPR